MSAALVVVPALARTQAVVRSSVDTTTVASPPVVSGVPNHSEAVTVVPFVATRYPHKIVLPAEVDGRRGIFVLDLGCPILLLNRAFFQPAPTGGVDTVRDGNRLPDSVTEDDHNTWEKVHVAVRIGTLRVQFDDRSLDQVPSKSARLGPYNAMLAHEFGNFGANVMASDFGPSPRLGNIGLAVLEQFETILDYVHRRVVLIRLDSAGHRLVPVPAYTPRWSAPLVDVDVSDYTPRWGVRAVRHNVSTLIQFDTGAGNSAPWGPVPGPDSLVIEGRTFPIPAGWGGDDHGPVLGYPFFEQVGVIGFNHRTHQVFLYQLER